MVRSLRKTSTELRCKNSFESYGIVYKQTLTFKIDFSKNFNCLYASITSERNETDDVKGG